MKKTIPLESLHVVGLGINYRFAITLFLVTVNFLIYLLRLEYNDSNKTILG